jgi:MoaA/NifB/PqqE/SkfB family radical SAM enzyme
MRRSRSFLPRHIRAARLPAEASAQAGSAARKFGSSYFKIIFCSIYMIEELTIEYSHRCNLDCLFCSSRNTIFNIKPSDKLNLEDIEKAIKKFKPKIVRWSGGEPFLYLNKNILEKVSSLTFPYEQIVTTNGTHPERVAKLAGYFFEIRVSIFGNKQTHEKITRAQGSWDKAIQTLESLKNKIDSGQKTKFLITSPYISKNQLQEVKAIAKTFKIDARITGLVPNKFIPRPNNIIESPTCSLGGENCRYQKKRLILPNGRIIHCAVEKIGFRCPYFK